MPDIFVAPNNFRKETNSSELLKSELIVKQDPIVDKKNVSLLTSFRVKPDGVSFRNQDEDEEIFLFLRKHFITNIPWIIFSLVLLFVPLPLVFLFKKATAPISLSSSYTIVLTAFYYLAVFSYILVGFITWFYNISLVTNKRVVDVDYSNVVYHDVALTKLDLIEDINFVQSGFIRSLFNYGDIFIQTAGEKTHFDFLAIPQPEKSANIIENLIGGDRDVI